MKFILSLILVVILVDFTISKYPHIDCADYLNKTIEFKHIKDFSNVKAKINRRIDNIIIFQSTFAIPDSAFDLIELKTLSVKQSVIKQISANSFQNAKNLKNISICQCTIETIHEDMFEPIADSIIELSLTKNKFDINKMLMAISKIRTLSYLDLSCNQISINNLMNYKLPDSLLVLRFDNNLINSEIFKLISNLKNLKDLNLENNLIEEIKMDHLEPFKELQKLSLSQNWIQTIPSSAFLNLSKLRDLQLKKQIPGIKTINNYAFAKYGNDLDYNSIDLSNNNINFGNSDCAFCSHHPTQQIYVKNLNIENNNFNNYFNPLVFLNLNSTQKNSMKPSLCMGNLKCDCNLNELLNIFDIKGVCLFRRSFFKIKSFLSSFCGSNEKRYTEPIILPTTDSTQATTEPAIIESMLPNTTTMETTTVSTTEKTTTAFILLNSTTPASQIELLTEKNLASTTTKYDTTETTSNASALSITRFIVKSKRGPLSS